MSDLVALVLGAAIAVVLIVLIHHKSPCSIASLDWVQEDCR